MSSLNNLNHLLTQARPGEWLYVQKDRYGREEYAVTNGYWDKFCLCIWDIFQGFSTTQNTQQAVHTIFQRTIDRLKENPSHYGPLGHTTEIGLYQAVNAHLHKVHLVWGKTFNVSSEIKPWDTLSFEQDIGSMEEVFSILPKQLQNQYAGLKQAVITAMDQWKLQSNRSDISNKDKVESWLNVALALKTCKENWLGGVDQNQRLSSCSLDFIPWCYQLDTWQFMPAHQSLKTAGGYEKTVCYLETYFEEGDLVSEWQQKRQALNKSDFSTWENGKIDSCVNKICDFIQDQAESQRRPISIYFNSWPNFLNHLSSQTTLEEQSQLLKFIKSLVSKIIDVAKAKPDLFIHTIALFNEVSKIQQKDTIDIGVCLSRLKGGFIDFCLQNETAYDTRRFYVTLSLSFSPVVQALISKFNNQLKKETQYVLSHPKGLLTISRKHEIELELMNLEESYDFVLQLCGKQKGCCKDILFEAFPVLEARKHFNKNADPSSFNLDSLQLASIAPGFEEWVLNALLTFAYTRQHPNLPTEQSENTRKAFSVYYALVDYLRPGSTDIEL